MRASLEDHVRKLESKIKKLEEERVMKEKVREITAVRRTEEKIREIKCEYKQEEGRLVKEMEYLDIQLQNSYKERETLMIKIGRVTKEKVQYQKQSGDCAAKLDEERARTQELLQQLRHSEESLQRMKVELEEKVRL